MCVYICAQASNIGKLSRPVCELVFLCVGTLQLINIPFLLSSDSKGAIDAVRVYTCDHSPSMGCCHGNVARKLLVGACDFNKDQLRTFRAISCLVADLKDQGEFSHCSWHCISNCIPVGGHLTGKTRHATS